MSDRAGRGSHRAPRRVLRWGWTLGWLGLLALAGCRSPSPGSAGPGGARGPDHAGGPARTASDAGPRPAKFHNLRFEEDWSFLADPEAGTTHQFPDAKWVELGDGWTASFGGQVRYRLQDETNKRLTEATPRDNDFNLVRTRVHADFQHADGFGFFVEGLDARIHGNSLPPLGIDANNLDVQNAFVSYRDEDWLYRVGRMELQQGAQRLISPLDWSNTRRTFQGGLVRHDGDGVRTDVFMARPVRVKARMTDVHSGSSVFGGVYSTMDLEDGDAVDVFVLKLEDDDKNFVGGNGVSEELDTYTLGARYWGKRGDTDYELWAARQYGDFAEDDIKAYAWTVAVGQSFPDAPYQPRIGLDVDFASGDSDPTDDDHRTFNQLFPLGHKYLGFLDLIGRQNIIDIQPSVTVKPDERTTVRLALHMFKLADRADAVYNAGGAASFADPTGAAGDRVGKEIDLTVAYTPESLAPHGHILLGWSRFLPGRHFESLGANGDARLLYAQLTLTF